MQSCAAAREGNARRVADVKRISTGFSGLYALLDCYVNMVAMDPSGRRRTCIPTAAVASMGANSTCLDEPSRAAIMVRHTMPLCGKAYVDDWPTDLGLQACRHLCRARGVRS